MDDPDEFRGAVDDFLDETEASTGELNVLVDAVRLGAVRRLLQVLDQGANPSAAVIDVGDGLARDRGSDDPARSRWAVAALGHALGRTDDELVRWFAVPSRSTPAPTTTPAPSETSPATSPPPLSTPAPASNPAHPSAPAPMTGPPAPMTMPPPGSTQPPPGSVQPPPTPVPPTPVPPSPAPMQPPTAPVRSGATVPIADWPTDQRESGPASQRPRRRATVWVIVLGLAALTMVVAAVVVVLVVSDDNTPGGSEADAPTGTEADPPTDPTPEQPPLTIEALDPGAVVSVPDLVLPEAPGTAVMASRNGGVALMGSGPVDTVGEGDRERGAPEGGSLLAFRLTGFDGCEIRRCRAWTRLGLRVEVDGASQPLPKGGPTFVVALPTADGAADLVLKDGRFRQSLSLLTGEPTGENIAVLARPRDERTARISAADGHFAGTATSDPSGGFAPGALDYEIWVESAELYFSEPRRPLGDPDLAYLRVVVTQQTGPNPRGPLKRMWLRFDGGPGGPSEAIALDPNDDGVEAVFKVSGDLRRGKLTVGGTNPVPVNGVAYQITIPRQTVQLGFGR